MSMGNIKDCEYILINYLFKNIFNVNIFNYIVNKPYT